MRVFNPRNGKMRVVDEDYGWSEGDMDSIFEEEFKIIEEEIGEQADCQEQ